MQRPAGDTTMPQRTPLPRRLATGATLAATMATTCLTAARAAAPPGKSAPAEETSRPQLVTARTRADPRKLADIQKGGKVFFADGFESPQSLKKYFEVRGLTDGRAKLTTDPKLAHAGKGALELTAKANNARESGAGASGWFGPAGYDRVYFRRYIRFAADYDQGNLNHVGGGLAAVAGADRWRAMGSAGIRPRGDDHFNSSFEPWRAWGRWAAPGYMFLYTYWMDMKRDRDGHFWGNMLEPTQAERIAPQRDRWYCLEHMIAANRPGKADGELAAWIDGKLYIHYVGIRWRTSDEVKLKRFDIGVYVHQARKDNTVWYDDVALSTGYVGPEIAKNAR